jgi:ABC-type multidrug transport system ATPase subunit
VTCDCLLSSRVFSRWLLFSKNVPVPNELLKTLNGIIDLTANGRGQHDSSDVLSFQDRLTSDRTHIIEQYSDSPIVRQIAELLVKLKVKQPETTVKVKGGSFAVTQYIDESNPNAKRKPKIATVYTTGPVGVLHQKLKRIWRTKSLCDKMSNREKYVMKDVNLSFEAGKTYLVLGAPQSGKSTLLKMIAGILPEDRDHKVGGEVNMNKFTPKSEGIVWTNLVGYINQIDRLHPYLTVKETCDFAWRCRTGGTHRTPVMGEGPEVDKEMARIDEVLLTVQLTLEGMGLKRVSDTFVGDQQTVRGVSGGEKKRVTVAEIGVGGYPVLCMDEISTGLDAATTYDICKLIGETSGLTKRVRIISLLQPPPETFALFDELILLSEGQVIYSGPVQKVVPHFESLGYR